MKYTLIKYKTIKMLINEGLDISPLIAHLGDIEELNEKVCNFHKNAMTATNEQGQALSNEARDLTSKIGYKIIGSPFDMHDAELYALNQQLDFEILELHGNTGKANATKEEPKTSHIHIRTTEAKKAGWIKQAQDAGFKKLTTWIEKKLDGEL